MSKDWLVLGPVARGECFRTAATGDVKASQRFGAHLPVKTQFVQVILGDLHELRLDLDLGRDEVVSRQHALENLEVLLVYCG